MGATSSEKCSDICECSIRNDHASSIIVPMSGAVKGDYKVLTQEGNICRCVEEELL